MTRRVLRIELRRSGLAVWLVPVLVAVFALVLVQQVLLPGDLAWATSIFFNLNPAIILLNVLTLTVGVWHGGRERRRGMRDLVAQTSRPRWHRLLAGWLPTAVWPAVAYLPALLAFGVLAATAVSGPPPFAVLTAAVTAVGCYAAAGFAVGRYVPGRFTAPVAGVAAFACLSFLGARVPTGLLSAVPQPVYGTIAFTRSGVDTWDRAAWWVAPAGMVWFAAVAAALLTVTVARRRLLALIPVVTAALVAVPILVGQGWRIDTTSPLLACSDGEVRVCVPRSFTVPVRNATGDGPGGDPPRPVVTRTVEVRLGPVADVTRTIRTRLAGLPTIHDVYIWPGRCSTDPTSASVSCTSGPDPSAAARQLARRATGWECPGTEGPAPPVYESPVPKLEAGVRAWLLGNTGRSAPEVTQRLAAMPEDERRAWLADYLRAANTCDPAATPELRAAQ